MTDLQKKFGPFAIPNYAGVGPAVLTWQTVEDRNRLVRESCDADWLQAVIRDRDVQATVRLAAQRRLRWVMKAVRQLRDQCRA